MGLLAWIVVGAIAGWLAGQVMKGSGLGLIGDIVIGVIGALVGGWLAGTLFNVPDAISGFNLTTIVVAFLGAVIVLFIARMLKR
ncbi:MAG: GlsB/YeaQ/YmgE family stress response membrane protein [Anaerolineales bacterium]